MNTECNNPKNAAVDAYRYIVNSAHNFYARSINSNGVNCLVSSRMFLNAHQLFVLKSLPFNSLTFCDPREKLQFMGHEVVVDNNMKNGRFRVEHTFEYGVGHHTTASATFNMWDGNIPASPVN